MFFSFIVRKSLCSESKWQHIHLFSTAVSHTSVRLQLRDGFVPLPFVSLFLASCVWFLCFWRVHPLFFSSVNGYDWTVLTIKIKIDFLKFNNINYPHNTEWWKSALTYTWYYARNSYNSISLKFASTSDNWLSLGPTE